jgi:tRNA(His) 5'-end guanylyltransferase
MKFVYSKSSPITVFSQISSRKLASSRYYILCKKLGIEPQDPDLPDYKDSRYFDIESLETFKLITWKNKWENHVYDFWHLRRGGLPKKKLIESMEKDLEKLRE